MSFMTSWLSCQIAAHSLWLSTAWGLAHLMLTSMIFSALFFISDPSFAYPCYYPCCRRYCFLLTGCSAIGVNGLSTSTHLSSYMEHLRQSWTPYLCQGLICTQLFSRYSSLWLPPSCVHSHQKHYRHVIYMMLDLDFITYFLYLLERTVSFNPGSGVPKGFSRYTA